MPVRPTSSTASSFDLLELQVYLDVDVVTDSAIIGEQERLPSTGTLYLGQQEQDPKGGGLVREHAFEGCLAEVGVT